MGDDQMRRTLESGRRFAKDAAREQMVVAEGIGCVDQDDVFITGEAEVLEAVIQNQDVAVVPIDSALCAGYAVGILDDDDPGCFLKNECSLITERFVGRKTLKIGRVGGRASGGGGEATREHGNTMARGEFFLSTLDDGGSLSGAACGDVSKTDDAGVHAMDATEFSNGHADADGRGARAERECERGGNGISATDTSGQAWK